MINDSKTSLRDYAKNVFVFWRFGFFVFVVGVWVMGFQNGYCLESHLRQRFDIMTDLTFIIYQTWLITS